MANNNELGAVEILEKGLGASFDNPTITVRCGFGRLIAYPTGDPGIFDEIEIDLLTDDGRVLQLACVGVDEENIEGYDGLFGPPDGYQPMHAYTWNGIDECVQAENYIEVSDDSFWYEKG